MILRLQGVYLALQIIKSSEESKKKGIPDAVSIPTTFEESLRKMEDNKHYPNNSSLVTTFMIRWSIEQYNEWASSVV